jgi:hypothetical protein
MKQLLAVHYNIPERNVDEDKADKGLKKMLETEQNTKFNAKYQQFLRMEEQYSDAVRHTTQCLRETISTESLDLISVQTKEIDGIDTLEGAFTNNRPDIILTWIVDTHTFTRQISMGTNEDKHIEVEQLLINIAMGANESLEAYSTRFRSTYERFSQHSDVSQLWTESKKVRLYVKSLNSNYNEWKIKLHNDQNMANINNPPGATPTDCYPSTLSKAIIAASGFVVSAPKSSSAFMAKAGGKEEGTKNQKSKKAKNAERKNDDKPGSASGQHPKKKPKSDAKQDSKSQPKADGNGKQKPWTRKCLCGEVHRYADCPQMKECIANMKQGAAVNKSHEETSDMFECYTLFGCDNAASVDSVPEVTQALMHQEITDPVTPEPIPADVETLTTPALIQKIKSSKSRLSDRDIVLDTGFSIDGGIMNRELCNSIFTLPNEPRTFRGIGTVETDQYCIASFNGQRYSFSEKFPANLLGFSHHQKQTTYDKDNNQFVMKLDDGRTMLFQHKDGLYVHRVPDEALAHVSVAENRSKYTKHELTRADTAGEMMARLGYPSVASYKHMLKYEISNTPITSVDVDRNIAINGPDIPSLRGKTRDPGNIAVPDTVPKTMIKEEQSLQVDLISINGITFLISLLVPADHVRLAYLVNKTTKMIQRALGPILASYKAYGVKITGIPTDGEGGVLASEQWINDKAIQLQHSGGSSIPACEAKGKVIKQRFRAIVTTLLFSLCTILVVYLVYYVARCINVTSFPSSPMGLSAHQRLTGTKLDEKVHLRCKYGDYIQAYNSNITDVNRNSVTLPRTDGCIALYPMLNAQGSVKCFSLSTQKIVTRNHFKVLPTPQHVINFMNERAKADPKPLHPTSDIVSTRTANESAIASQPTFLPPNDLVDISNPVDDLQPTISPTIVHPDDLIPTANDNSQLQLRGAQDEIANQIGNVQQATSDNNINPMAEQLQQQEDNSSGSGEGNLEFQPENANEQEQLVSKNATQQATSPTNQLPTSDFSTQRSRPVRSTRTTWQENSGWKAREAMFIHGVRHKPHERKVHIGLHITQRAAIKKLGKVAVKAMAIELMTQHNFKVFHPIHLHSLSTTQAKKILRSSLFCKEKYLPSGVFEKIKARMVAGGNDQPREDYGDLYSPTVSMQATLMLGTIAAKEKRHVVTMDVTGAYLKTEIGKQNVYIRINEYNTAILCEMYPEIYKDFICDDGTMVVKLDKALYGLIESAKLWHATLSQALTDIGFVSNAVEPCVFNLEKDGVQCSICIYVDDLFITCADIKLLDFVTQSIKNKFKDVTINTGKVHSYLGMTMDFTQSGKVKVTQRGFIDDVLFSYGVQGKASSPALPDLFTIDESSPLLQDIKREEFHSWSAKLLYLCKRTRPEIMVVVSFLTSRVLAPTEQDWSKLDRCMKYLNSTRDLGLVLSASQHLHVVSHVDASFGVHPTMKSHTGSMITLGGGAIFAKSSKQKLNTKSSTESELVGLSDSASQVIWTREFLIAQGYDMEPATIYQDNQSTIALIAKGRSTAEATRHINIRFYFVKDRIDSGELEVSYMPTQNMIADILTKPLQGELFRRLRKLLLEGE